MKISHVVVVTGIHKEDGKRQKIRGYLKREGKVRTFPSLEEAQREAQRYSDLVEDILGKADADFELRYVGKTIKTRF